MKNKFKSAVILMVGGGGKGTRLHMIKNVIFKNVK